MERLTSPHKSDKFTDEELKSSMTYRMISKLSEYEDIGLSPTEVKVLISYHANGRWNIDKLDDGSIHICRGEHDKNDSCIWERFIPD